MQVTWLYGNKVFRYVEWNNFLKQMAIWQTFQQGLSDEVGSFTNETVPPLVQEPKASLAIWEIWAWFIKSETGNFTIEKKLELKFSLSMNRALVAERTELTYLNLTG